MGDLFAAACILPADAYLPGLNDSKHMSEATRDQLAIEIKKIAVAYSINSVNAPTIDRAGLNPSNRWAMETSAVLASVVLGGAPQIKHHQAVRGKLHWITEIHDKSDVEWMSSISVSVVDQSPGFKYNPHLMMSKADATSLAVAAASVLAKTARDSSVYLLDEMYPMYKWRDSKGYINADHKAAVLKHGLVPGIHRESYRVEGVNKPRQISMFDF